MIYYFSNEEHITIDTPRIKRIYDLKKFILSFKQENLLLGVDTETEGFDPYTKKIISLQIGNFENQYVIYIKNLSKDDLFLLKDILENNQIILHNAKFDLKFFYHLRIIPNIVFDTYLQELVLTLGLEKTRTLEAVALEYEKVQLDKKARGLIFKERYSERTILYAAEDVKYLIPIHNKQTQKLKQNNLLNAAKLENKFVLVLAYTEYCGIYLNTDKWKLKIERDKEDLQNSLNSLNDWIIKFKPNFLQQQLNLFSEEKIVDLNWDSSIQVIKLFKELGINTEIIDKATGDLKHSVEEGVILPQLQKFPIIDLYLKYKKLSKIQSTYGENFLKLVHPITGRIHTNFFQIMKTGRLSCGGKDKDTGAEYVNLQNIPKDAPTRSCFTISCEDNVLIDADFSGQEQIVLANMSLEPNLLEFYDKKLGEMHSFIASKLFKHLTNIPLNEIKKLYPEEREKAKIAGFSINYGGDGKTIATKLSLPVEVGNEVYTNYFLAFPKLDDFFKKSHQQALSNGYILFNNTIASRSYFYLFEKYKTLEQKIRASHFWELYREEKNNNTNLFLTSLKPLVREYFSLQGEMKRKSVNYKIQGTSAQITKISGILFFDFLRKNNLLFTILLSNFIHDEILVESPKKLQNLISENLKTTMEIAGKIFCKRVPLTASPMISDHWIH